MSEQWGGAVLLLDRAVDLLLQERPIELPGPAALDRCAQLLVLQERLGAAALAAVGDVDRRELFALDAAGSARSCLRGQVGGDGGQLVLARRLAERSLVWQAVLDGGWDVRGHLDHQTGTLLAAEAAGPEAVAAFQADPFDPFDPALPPAAGPYRPLLSKGRLRHDDLTQLLLDAADADTATGQPAPVAITIVASLSAVEGRDGALPGQVQTAGRPFTVRPETLQRMGCYCELTAVLLDAAGRPVGVSSTRRSADRRERAALTALWGPWCAVEACARTTTVPHHVRPWWLSRETILRDLIPLCAGCHHDVHDGHRTLRLKDNRLIDEHGWA